ncbi:hypothetical protein B0T14DRAFT_494064 [Immersiella caudata]|uniref:Uncharacterized protein n=1 Tax=Immersiella caudata TaxID=314043 RepID=A0AA39WVL9_9PEZI|nr:hypothetical protein B0T14DRAFT_494064 [Immersiella caudata]
MLPTTTLLASFGLLFGGIQALPQPLEDPFVAALEHIHASTPLVWHEGINGNYTDIDNAVWDEAIGAVGLQKRQSGTHCHGSGSWAKQVVLLEDVGTACDNLRNRLSCPLIYHLKLTSLLPIGDTPAGYTRLYRAAGYNSNGDSMDVHFQKSCNNFDGNSGTRHSRCVTAMQHIINSCEGRNRDTRGGTTNGPDGNWYAADPQTHNCNC